MTLLRFFKTMEHRKWCIAGAIAVFLALLIVGGYVVRTHATSSLARNVETVMKLCAQETYRSACYDREIPKLMSRLSMEETFKVTRLVQDADAEYPYCHVLGHLVGGIETAKDPGEWKEVAGRCPTDMCSNGCMHGVFQERFRKDALPTSSVAEISELLGGICEPKGDWNSTSLRQGTCTHALGHLTMYITEADTRKSLAACDAVAQRVPGRDFRPLCYDGVFMQMFQPLEPDDFALVEGKVPQKDAVLGYCAQFAGEQHNSCWSESWPLVKDELKTDPTYVVQFCATLAGTGGEKRCRDDLFYILAVQFNLDLERITDYCTKGTDTLGGRCFAMAASRLVEVDERNVEKAVALCRVSESAGAGDACYEKLARDASYDFEKDSPAFVQLCESLPQKWKRQCVSGGR